MLLRDAIMATTTPSSAERWGSTWASLWDTELMASGNPGVLFSKWDALPGMWACMCILLMSAANPSGPSWHPAVQWPVLPLIPLFLDPEGIR